MFAGGVDAGVRGTDESRVSVTCVDSTQRPVSLAAADGHGGRHTAAAGRAARR